MRSTYREELEAQKCRCPGCLEAGVPHAFAMLPACCPDSGHKLHYDPGSGCLTLNCHNCGKWLAQIAVALAAEALN